LENNLNAPELILKFYRVNPNAPNESVPQYLGIWVFNHYERAHHGEALYIRMLHLKGGVM
jgi:hypothetical protein